MFKTIKMTIDLYINNYNVDITDVDKVALTLQAFDVSQLDSIVTSFTKTIKLPLTARNTNILQNAHLINANCDAIVHSKIPCKLVIDGIEVITSGYCYVVNVDEYFNINIFFSSFMLFDELKDLSLNDLDLSNLNHYWNKDNILKLTSPALSDEIQYPIMEWGEEIISDDTDYLTFTINLEALLPVVSVQRIINQILEDSKYSLGNSLDYLYYIDNLFLCVASLKADDTTNDDVENSLAEVAENNQHDYTVAMENLPATTWYGGGPFSGSFRFGAVHFDDTVLNFFYQIEQMPPVTDRTEQWTRFRVTTTGKIKFKTKIKFDDPIDTNSQFDVAISIAVITNPNGNFYDTDENGKGPTYSTLVFSEGPTWLAPLPGGGNGWVNGINYAEVEIEDEFYPGDFICVIIQRFGETNTNYCYLDETDTYFEVVTDSCDITGIGYGYWWNIALNLPEIYQVDFLKAICQLYNLVITKDLTRNIVYIRRWDDVFKNIPIANDWTDKILYNPKPKINYIPEGLARKNWLKYSELTFLNKTVDYAYSFDVDNAMLDKEKDLIASILRPAPHVQRTALHLSIPQVKLINLGYQVTEGINPVVLYVKDKYLDDKFIVYSSDIESYNIIVAETTYVKAWFEDVDGSEGGDLKWQTLAEDYYAKYINMMQNYKQLIVSVKISLVEIQNFDFSIPIFLDQFQSYFYVNAIKDYSNGFATVELIKLY